MMAGRSELVRHWAVLAASFIGVTFGVASLFYYTVGVFLKPLAAEFGWSRSQFAAGTLVATVGMAGMAPLIGAIIDRLGLRLLAILSMLGLALGFWMLSRQSGAIGFYLAAMGAIAVLGAGTSPVVFTRLINQWFDKSLGLALGITLAGTGVAGAIAPRILAGYIDDHGWRAAYLAMALAVLAATPVVGLLIRERSGAISSRAHAQEAPAGIAFSSAAKSGRFWLLVAVFFCVALGIGGVIAHFIPMLTDAGLSPRQAGSIAALIGLAVIAGRIVTGWLIDRLFAPNVAAFLCATAAAGCIGLAAGGSAAAPVAAILVGFAMGAEVDLIGYLVSRYFGMRSYGVIYGCQYTSFILGVSTSAITAGAVFDSFGTYSPAWYGAAGALGLGAFLVTRLGQYPSLSAAGSVAPREESMLHA